MEKKKTNIIITPLLFILNVIKTIISIIISILRGAIIIILAPLCILLITLAFLIEFFLLHITKKIIKLKLKSIVDEAWHIYNTDIIQFEHLIFCKKHNLTSVKIPTIPKGISKTVKTFKEKIGCIDNDFFLKNIYMYSVIKRFKHMNNSVFFSPINKNKLVLQNIHLYDLNNLDFYELESIYRLNISDEQKLLIYKKYNYDKI